MILYWLFCKGEGGTLGRDLSSHWLAQMNQEVVQQNRAAGCTTSNEAYPYYQLMFDTERSVNEQRYTEIHHNETLQASIM